MESLSYYSSFFILSVFLLFSFFPIHELPTHTLQQRCSNHRTQHYAYALEQPNDASEELASSDKEETRLEALQAEESYFAYYGVIDDTKRKKQSLKGSIYFDAPFADVERKLLGGIAHTPSSLNLASLALNAVAGEMVEVEGWQAFQESFFKRILSNSEEEGKRETPINPLPIGARTALSSEDQNNLVKRYVQSRITSYFASRQESLEDEFKELQSKKLLEVALESLIDTLAKKLNIDTSSDRLNDTLFSVFEVAFFRMKQEESDSLLTTCTKLLLAPLATFPSSPPPHSHPPSTHTQRLLKDEFAIATLPPTYGDVYIRPGTRVGGQVIPSGRIGGWAFAYDMRGIQPGVTTNYGAWYPLFYPYKYGNMFTYTGAPTEEEKKKITLDPFQTSYTPGEGRNGSPNSGDRGVARSTLMMGGEGDGSEGSEPGETGEGGEGEEDKLSALRFSSSVASLFQTSYVNSSASVNPPQPLPLDEAPAGKSSTLLALSSPLVHTTPSSQHATDLKQLNYTRDTERRMPLQLNLCTEEVTRALKLHQRVGTPNSRKISILLRSVEALFSAVSQRDSLSHPEEAGKGGRERRVDEKIVDGGYAPETSKSLSSEADAAWKPLTMLEEYIDKLTEMYRQFPADANSIKQGKERVVEDAVPGSEPQPSIISAPERKGTATETHHHPHLRSGHLGTSGPFPASSPESYTAATFSGSLSTTPGVLVNPQKLHTEKKPQQRFSWLLESLETPGEEMWREELTHTHIDYLCSRSVRAFFGGVEYDGSELLRAKADESLGAELVEDVIGKLLEAGNEEKMSTHTQFDEFLGRVRALMRHIGYELVDVALAGLKEYLPTSNDNCN